MIRVRVVQLADDSYAVEKETSPNVWQALPKTFTEDQEDKALKYASKQFDKLNGGGGPKTILLLG